MNISSFSLHLISVCFTSNKYKRTTCAASRRQPVVEKCIGLQLRTRKLHGPFEILRALVAASLLVQLFTNLDQSATERVSVRACVRAVSFTRRYRWSHKLLTLQRELAMLHPDSVGLYGTSLKSWHLGYLAEWCVQSEGARWCQMPSKNQCQESMDPTGPCTCQSDIVYYLFFYRAYKSLLTYLVHCISSRPIIGISGLNSVDVPLRNKQTNKHRKNGFVNKISSYVDLQLL